MEELYLKIDQKIKESKNIAIFMHASPDGDTIWSALSLYEVIITNFPGKKVDVINKDPCNLFHFLPNVDKVVHDFNIDDYDLIITVDMAVVKLCWFWDNRAEIFKEKFLVNIDHHPNTFYWDINLVEDKKPATTLVLYDFFEYIWYKMNKNVANCLLTWIYTDTWSFAYSNVTNHTFSASSKLIWLGAQNMIINDNFFSNLNFNFLMLYSLVLERLTIKDKFAISYLKNEDLESIWCTNEDIWSIVSRLNELVWVDYVIFIYEKWEIVKWSLRTNKDDVNLIEIARNYNWWWHRKACWFILNWKIEKDENNSLNVRLENGELIKF